MADEQQPNGQEPFMTTREMVKEVRKDIKALSADMKLLATSQAHQDHEHRLRSIERWKYSVPVASLTTLISALSIVWINS
jgi:hypothetical protein